MENDDLGIYKKVFEEIQDYCRLIKNLENDISILYDNLIKNNNEQKNFLKMYLIEVNDYNKFKSQIEYDTFIKNMHNYKDAIITKLVSQQCENKNVLTEKLKQTIVNSIQDLYRLLKEGHEYILIKAELNQSLIEKRDEGIYSYSINSNELILKIKGQTLHFVLNKNIINLKVLKSNESEILNNISNEKNENNISLINEIFNNDESINKNNNSKNKEIVSKCSSIDHRNIDAIIFCHICKKYFCNQCQSFHSNIFQNHITQKISDMNKEIFTGLCQDKNHINILKYYCKNHNQLCCVACIGKIKDEINGKHNDCEIFKLKDIKPQKEKKFNEDYNKLQDIYNLLEPKINKFNSLIDETNINKNKEELIKKIQKTFTNLRYALNKREEQLLSEVEEKFKNIYDDNIIKEIENLSKKVKEGLESINLLKEKNELNYEINYYIEFENNFNKINEINEKLIEFNSKEIVINFEINNNEIENIIKKIGNINKNVFDDYEKVDQIYIELDDNYTISNLIEEEEVKRKIRELNYDKDEIFMWAEKVIYNLD